MADPLTPADRLAALDAAISGVLTGGQRVRYKDREVTYADYPTLVAARKALALEIGGTVRVRFPSFRANG